MFQTMWVVYDEYLIDLTQIDIFNGINPMGFWIMGTLFQISHHVEHETVKILLFFIVGYHGDANDMVWLSTYIEAQY